jgi:hypothetical protein
MNRERNYHPTKSLRDFQMLDEWEEGGSKENLSI